MPNYPIKILKNFNFLAIGKILGDMFTFFLFVVLSRVFGEEGIGQYSFAMAFTGFFVVFSEFGLYYFSIKELNQPNLNARTPFGTIFTLRLILSFVVLVGLMLVLAFLSFSFETKIVIALIGIYQIIYVLVDGFAAVFIARDDAFYAGLLESSLRIATALLGIGIAVMGGSLVMVLMVIPLVTFAQFLIAYKIFVSKYGQIQFNSSLTSLVQTAREAFPYALSTLLYPLASRVDTVFLGFFLSTAAAGIYNVSYRVVYFLQFAPYFAGVVLLPIVTKLASQQQGELKSFYRQTMSVTLLLGIPCASGLYLVTSELIEMAFGQQFLQSVPILKILTGLLFLLFFNHILATFLMGCDKQSERIRCQWVCAWANVVGNLCLIPVLGINGAAFATVASEACLVALYMRLLWETLGGPQIGLKLLVSLVGVMGMCLPFMLLPSVSRLLLIPVAIVSYFGVLASFRNIRENEYLLLLSWFGKNKNCSMT